MTKLGAVVLPVQDVCPSPGQGLSIVPDVKPDTGVAVWVWRLYFIAEGCSLGRINHCTNPLVGCSASGQGSYGRCICVLQVVAGDLETLGTTCHILHGKPIFSGIKDGQPCPCILTEGLGVRMLYRSLSYPVPLIV